MCPSPSCWSAETWKEASIVVITSGVRQKPDDVAYCTDMMQEKPDDSGHKCLSKRAVFSGHREAVATRAQPGNDAHFPPGKRIVDWQRMGVQPAVCGLLAQNMGSLAMSVSLPLRLLACNASRKCPLFAGSGAPVCRPLHLLTRPMIKQWFACNVAILLGRSLRHGRPALPSLATRYKPSMKVCQEHHEPLTDLDQHPSLRIELHISWHAVLQRSDANDRFLPAVSSVAWRSGYWCRGCRGF